MENILSFYFGPTSEPDGPAPPSLFPLPACSARPAGAPARSALLGLICSAAHQRGPPAAAPHPGPLGFQRPPLRSPFSRCAAGPHVSHPAPTAPHALCSHYTAGPACQNRLPPLSFFPDAPFLSLPVDGAAPNGKPPRPSLPQGKRPRAPLPFLVRRAGSPIKLQAKPRLLPFPSTVELSHNCRRQSSPLRCPIHDEDVSWSLTVLPRDHRCCKFTF